MKILVTGASGFIGSRLVEELLRTTDSEIIGIDSLTDYYDVRIKKSNLSEINDSRFELVEADLVEADLEALLENVTEIFHLAGQPGVRASWGENFAHYLRCNVAATQKLLEAAIAQGSISRFVYASSSSVYGDAETYPTSETARPQPRSPYGVTKLAAEHLCELYAANFGLPTISLRFFTVYGPRQRPDMAFNRFCSAILTNTPIPLFGDGSQIRDFTYVDDIVAAMLKARSVDYAPGEVVNLSGGSSVSITEVLNTLSQVSGRELVIENLPKVDGDVFRTGGDSTRAHDVLGWSPSVALRDGLELQFKWMEKTAHIQEPA